jgi:hypothetical protein
MLSTIFVSLYLIYYLLLPSAVLRSALQPTQFYLQQLSLEFSSEVQSYWNV